MRKIIWIIVVIIYLILANATMVGLALGDKGNNIVSKEKDKLEKKYIWYNGDREEQVFAAQDEIAIFPKDSKKTLMQSFDAQSTLIKDYEFLTIERLPSRLDINVLEDNVIEFHKKTGSKANFVFYRGPTKDQAPMALTGEIIVKFKPEWDETKVKEWAKNKGLDIVKSFPFSPNTYLFNVEPGLRSLEIANQIYLSGQVVYAYPNWWKAMNTRAIPNDSLFSNQWHLNNTGQSGGTLGEDVNITSVWDLYRGSENEVIAIVDDGLELLHEDLAPNILPGYSWDYIENDPDPTAGAHGTSVAGVAAARGWNTLGITGAAPYTRLIGYRLAGTDANDADALSNNSQIVDIYSNSWGPTDNRHLEAPVPLTLEALANGVTNGRGGKGSIYVWAGGNGNSLNEVSADNSNYDGYANSRYVMAIAASNNTGRHSKYSEHGANILVNAPSSNTFRDDPDWTVGITTTDRTGSLGNDPGNYRDSFGGTSSATPLVSGIISLMLQANPSLSWRDIRLILAKTAEKNDPTDPDWTRNGAGYNINHKYGFGRIDAYAAVNAAINLNSVGPEVTTVAYKSPNLPIPDDNLTGISDTITIAENINIEFVEINFTTADHAYWGDLEIELISPSGTKSILAKRHNVANSTQRYDNWIFGSVRQIGEFSKGTWRLTVRDLKNGDTGTFQRWGLRIYGTTPSRSGGPDNFGYTFKDSNVQGGPTYDWIEINTTGTEILNNSDDNYIDGIPVGFFFNFYGTDYSQLSITNNGLILASGGTSQYINQPIGSSTPHNFIAPFWDDIVTWGSGNASAASRQIDKDKESRGNPITALAMPAPPGAIYYQTIGTAPNRMFVVEWYDNQHFRNSEFGVTFEAILYEGTNNIKFQYKDVEFGNVTDSTGSDLPPYDKGGSATVGIESSDGRGLQYSYNEQVLSPGLAILFKFPQYAGTNLHLSKQAPVSKDRGSTMLYTLYYHNFGDTAALNVVLNDTLPTGVEFVSASDGGNYNPITRNVTWNIGNTVSSGHGYKNVTARINQSVEIGTVIQNNARISTSNIEVRYDDNEAQAQTRVTGSNLPPNVSVEPNNGGTTPSVYYRTPTTFSYHSCPTATGVNITIHIDDGGPDITGSMTGGPPDWAYTTTFYPRTGHATVTYTIYGCNQETVNFNIYIDPAGYIYDIITGSRITGASVWLQRPDGQGGWVNVPAGQSPPIMQPDVNPLITGTDGQYQWDVIAGSYRVHAEAPGYYPADSIAVSVPPPVTDLHVGLTRMPGNITGQITYSNNGTGISDVLVNLTNSIGVTVSTTSNASGFYSFSGIEADNYNVSASKPSFFKNSTSITLNTGESKEANLMLWLKGDLNNDGKLAKAVDVNMMLQASVGDIILDGG